MNKRFSRRDFSKNIAAFGLGGALALLLGLRKVDAGYCYNFWESRPVSACQSKQRQVTVCNGVIVGYGAWGYFSHNNCAYFGKTPRCCS